MNSKGTSVLPETLTWYRDAANWVVGLSTGAVAAGIAYRSDVLAGPLPARYVFVIGGAAFLIAILAGIQFYFWITTYANQRERRARLQADLAAETQVEKKAELAQQIEGVEPKLDRSQRRFGYFYTVLLWAFHTGLIAYGLSTLWLVLRPGPAIARVEDWSLVTVPCCPVARCRIPEPHVLRIERTTGRTWYLTSDSIHLATWRLIPADSALADSAGPSSGERNQVP